MTRRLALPFLVAVTLALGSCDRPRTIDALPALFVARDADTTIWLFGTIHLLPGNVRWDGPAMATAIDQADLLVTEIPDEALQHGAATFDAMAHADHLPPALARVPPARRTALARAIAAAGLSTIEADRLKSWALATQIGAAAARGVGASRDTGLETQLATRFRSANKPQRAFESLAGQLALFDGLPERDQRVLLAATLDELGDSARGYPATLAAWIAGDTARLAASISPAFARDPALGEALLYGRNRRWARWIAARMRQPGRVLVAVGAGHLVGPRSVIALLRARGLDVRRVQ